ERKSELHRGEESCTRVIESPLGTKDRQNRADQADYDSIQDEAATKQIKNHGLRSEESATLRGSWRGNLRFRSHHGILPEPKLRRKWRAGWLGEVVTLSLNAMAEMERFLAPLSRTSLTLSPRQENEQDD